jgi:hypothetical protein
MCQRGRGYSKASLEMLHAHCCALGIPSMVVVKRARLKETNEGQVPLTSIHDCVCFLIHEQPGLGGLIVRAIVAESWYAP